VHHIDEKARAALTKHYSSSIAPDSRVLDLASSWVSHLPEELSLSHVTGLGMNEAELKENPRLDDFLMQDLNKDPIMPFEDDTFDAVTCAVSIDYMVRPREVLAEVSRVLKPGGLSMMAFSNRCFPSKVISMWLQADDSQRMQMVGMFYHFASQDPSVRLFEPPQAFSVGKKRGDPMYIVQSRSLAQ